MKQKRYCIGISLTNVLFETDDYDQLKPWLDNPENTKGKPELFMVVDRHTKKYLKEVK
jgi:hypothetical protein